MDNKWMIEKTMDIDLDSIGKTKLSMIAQLVQSLPMHNYLETTIF